MKFIIILSILILGLILAKSQFVVCLAILIMCYFLIKKKWEKLRRSKKYFKDIEEEFCEKTRSEKESKYIVKKRGFKGKYITSDKKEADDLLESGTIVDHFKNGEYHKH